MREATLPARLLPEPAPLRKVAKAPPTLLGVAVPTAKLPTRKQLSRLKRELDEYVARYIPIPFRLTEKSR